MIFLALASYLLTFYGAYGPFTHPPIPFLYDNLIALAIGLVADYWGVASGYQTEEMRIINDSGVGIIPELTAEEQSMPNQ